MMIVMVEKTRVDQVIKQQSSCFVYVRTELEHEFIY